MVSKGYTLWLVPQGEVYNKFSTLIKKLASEYGGPVFVPHVTLLGDIELSEDEMVKRMKQLIMDQQPFQVNLDQISYEDFYFRALIVKAEKNASLQTLHEKTKQIFDMHNIPSYMAHLSLLYGDYPNQIKEKIIAEIGKEQPAQFEVTSVFLTKGGEVKDWKVIREFSFS